MTKLATLKPRVAMMQASRVATLVPGSWRTSDMSAADRGYDHRWRKARAAYLSSHPLCAYCERDGRVTAATVVDHKVPHRGDQALFWDQDNWQSLCSSHHSSDKQREENAG